jgi:hypothetical protein
MNIPGPIKGDKKSLQIMATVSKFPLQLKAGPFYHLNIGTFTSVSTKISRNIFTAKSRVL